MGTIQRMMAAADQAAQRHRVALLVVTAVLLGVAIGTTGQALLVADRWNSWAVDLRLFQTLGHRWLETGSIYTADQLAGPYVAAIGPGGLGDAPGLYPPAIGPVFGVVALMPSLLYALWWGIPLSVMLGLLVFWRPARWTWPLIACCLAWPQTTWQFMVGGSSMWMAALVAAGLEVPGLAAFLLLKPTLLPFALIGVNHRKWWLAAGLVLALDLAGPWQAYLSVVANASDTGGALYSLGHFALVAIPLIAWVGRTNPGARRRWTPAANSDRVVTRTG